MLSRIGTVLTIVVWISTTPAGSARAQSGSPKGAAASAPSENDPQQIFANGERALAGGNLDQAELDFKRVLALDPRAAPAYANLGVIHMRRKQWDTALTNLRQAEKLAPTIPGIRLNMGLAYYRQGDYRHAVPPFESVVKDAPDSVQARYLLGQCYFFTERYVEAADALNVSSATLNRLTKRGLLRPCRATRRPLYSIREIERFLRETTAEINAELERASS